MEFVQNEKAPKAVGPYSQAVVSGNLVFCSGQIPLNPETMKIQAVTIEDQTRQVLANLNLVLGTVGLNLSHIVKTTVFMKNLADFPRMNSVYTEVMKEHRPARSTIEVSRLPMDAQVEIECIAEIKK